MREKRGYRFVARYPDKKWWFMEKKEYLGLKKKICPPKFEMPTTNPNSQLDYHSEERADILESH